MTDERFKTGDIEINCLVQEMSDLDLIDLEVRVRMSFSDLKATTCVLYLCFHVTAINSYTLLSKIKIIFLGKFQNPEVQSIPCKW